MFMIQKEALTCNMFHHKRARTPFPFIWILLVVGSRKQDRGVASPRMIVP